MCLGSEYARVHNIMSTRLDWNKTHEFLKWNLFLICYSISYFVLVTLNKLLLLGISFLRIICKVES